MRRIPLVLMSFAVYWALVAISVYTGLPTSPGDELVSFTMPSGRPLRFTGSDVSILVTVLLLVWAMQGRSLEMPALGLIGQATCLVIALVAIGLLLFMPAASTPAFALLIIAAVIEGGSSRTIGLRVSRRVIDVSDDEDDEPMTRGRAWANIARKKNSTMASGLFDIADKPSEPAPRIVPHVAPSDVIIDQLAARAPSAAAAERPRARLEGIGAAADPIDRRKYAARPTALANQPRDRPEGVGAADEPGTGFMVRGADILSPIDPRTILTNPHVVSDPLRDHVSKLWEPVSSPYMITVPDAAKAAPSQADDVDCSVFAPAQIARGSDALVQVLLHLKADLMRAAKMARTADAKAGRRGFASLELPVRRGTDIELMIEAPDLIIAEHFGAVVWAGEPQRVVFPVKVPPQCAKTEIRGTVYASVDGVPVGEVEFSVHVAHASATFTPPAQALGLAIASDARDPAPESDIGPASTAARRYRSAFISYARADFEKVSFFAQGLEQTGIKPFVDVTNIEPGDEWPAKLQEGIQQADVFYLMWSENAAKSTWVEREARAAFDRYARSADGRPLISAITIHRGAPNPPGYLAKVQFNSRWLAHREAQRTPLFST